MRLIFRWGVGLRVEEPRIDRMRLIFRAAKRLLSGGRIPIHGASDALPLHWPRQT